MDQASIDFLVAQSREQAPRLGDEMDRSLRELDAQLSAIADALRVEYVGPGIGMREMGAEHVFRLVVRHHVWNVTEAGWGLKVCDGLPNAALRPMWPIYGVSRLRKRQLVQVLPEFFQGYAEAVRRANKAQSEAGERLMELAAAFQSS